MTADRSIGRQSHQKKKKKVVWSTRLVGRHFDMSKSGLMVKFKRCLDLEYHLWITIALEGNRQWHSEEKTRCGLEVKVKVENSSHDGDCEIQVMVEIVVDDLEFHKSILMAILIAPNELSCSWHHMG
jgi:hypothetical protein